MGAGLRHRRRSLYARETHSGHARPRSFQNTHPDFRHRSERIGDRTCAAGNLFQRYRKRCFACATETFFCEARRHLPNPSQRARHLDVSPSKYHGGSAIFTARPISFPQLTRLRQLLHATPLPPTFSISPLTPTTDNSSSPRTR